MATNAPPTNIEFIDNEEHAMAPSPGGIMMVMQDPRAKNLHPMASLQSQGASSQVSTTTASTNSCLMNRRPKINENNIKLIERVIKRQNLTAQ